MPKIKHIEEIHDGIPKDLAEEYFSDIEKFGLYSFCQSHSAAYSIIGYIAMYLKTYYPAEFYAGCLTYLSDDKVRQIILEAKKQDIDISPPHINKSTDKFYPVDDRTIVAPLNRVKYVAAAATHIMEVRNEGGPFIDLADFENRTTKRIANKRVKEALGSIGALDTIDPEWASMDLTERSRAINEYMPSIPLGFVKVDRKIDLTAKDKSKLNELIEPLKEFDNVAIPYLGKTPKMVIIYDKPSASELKSGKFTETKAFNSTALAMYRAGLDKADAYYTGYSKTTLGKAGASPAEHNANMDFLKTELAIINPAVVVLLGSNAIRAFFPDTKGNAMESACNVVYNKELDINFVFGFNPAQIHFNPDYSDTLIEVFEIANGLV